MGAAGNLHGHVLPGRRTKQKWTVIEELSAGSEITPNAYSVGYKVQSDSGQYAFMKATDLGLTTNDGEDPLERMRIALELHKFERDILDYCHGNNMDRIVTALDYGNHPVVVDGVQDAVFFLVFELAEGDARIHIDPSTKLDLAWCVAALHDLATAVRQLHSGRVSHNDIKPGNFLTFDRRKLQKLADLGNATSEVMAGIYDQAHCAGDPRYAPPEILYASTSEECRRLCQFNLRRAADIYHLGSMAYFFISGRMITPEIVRRLAPEHRPFDEGRGWTGTFHGVLPYWREALSRVLEEIPACFDATEEMELNSISSQLIEAIIQLTEPLPSLRGHPRNRIGHTDPFDVSRYVSLFNLLSAKLARRH